MRRNSRLVLLLGFGGVLLMMAFAGIDAMRVFRSVRGRNDAIRRSFLSRNRLLNEIRAGVYLSGTYLRDYLLEPDAAIAARNRAAFEASHRTLDADLAGYKRVAAPGEAQAVESLQRQLAAYWQTLDPVIAWSPRQRLTDGYTFLRDQVFPRRMAMLGLADGITRINEAQLTEGDREANELFRDFAIRLSLTLLITLVLGVLLALSTTRRVLRLENESAAAREQLKELSARVVAAQEDERRTIARELHDEVGQALLGLRVGLTNLTSMLPSAAAPQVDGLRSLAENTIRVVRNITLLLRPSMLDDLGLIPALEWQGREVSRSTGISVRVAASGVPDDLPDEFKTCVYRVTQEALNNCARHSGAASVRVAVRVEDALLTLSIEDDGRGFHPETHRGIGLLGMEERAAHLGGRFEVRSQPERGALITVTLPLNRTTEA